MTRSVLMFSAQAIVAATGTTQWPDCAPLTKLAQHLLCLYCPKLSHAALRPRLGKPVEYTGMPCRQLNLKARSPGTDAPPHRPVAAALWLLTEIQGLLQLWSHQNTGVDGPAWGQGMSSAQGQAREQAEKYHVKGCDGAR